MLVLPPALHKRTFPLPRRCRGGWRRAIAMLEAVHGSRLANGQNLVKQKLW